MSIRNTSIAGYFKVAVTVEDNIDDNGCRKSTVRYQRPCPNIDPNIRALHLG